MSTSVFVWLVFGTGVIYSEYPHLPALFPCLEANTSAAGMDEWEVYRLLTFFSLRTRILT